MAALAGRLNLAPPAGVPGALVPADVAPAAPAQGIVAGTDDFTPGALQWVLAEAVGAFSYGTVVVCPLPLVRNRRVVQNWPQQGDIFIKCVDGQDLVSFRDLPASRDSKMLPVIKNAAGIPQRTLSSLVRDSRREVMAWVKLVPGEVRSAEWCLSYLDAEGVGFEGHHVRVKQLLVNATMVVA